MQFQHCSVQCCDVCEALGGHEYMWHCVGRLAYLILSTLGVEHGDKHVPVTVSPSFVGSEDVTKRWWRCLGGEVLEDELHEDKVDGAHLLEDVP